MKARNVDQGTHIRDEPPSGGDRYARESFTWRRMQPRHIWALAIAAAVLVALGIVYV